NIRPFSYPPPVSSIVANINAKLLTAQWVDNRSLFRKLRSQRRYSHDFQERCIPFIYNFWWRAFRRQNARPETNDKIIDACLIHGGSIRKHGQTLPGGLSQSSQFPGLYVWQDGQNITEHHLYLPLNKRNK